MKTNNSISKFIQCPSAEDYQLYLSGKGSPEFNEVFQQHIDNCQLCAEAIEGYRLMNMIPDTEVKHLPEFESNNLKGNRVFFYLIGSAAAILLIIAGWWSYNNSDKNTYDFLAENQGIDNEYRVDGITQGKLANQLTENYWYVCNNSVFVNDQVVKPQALNEVIDGIDASKSLIIEVGCSCNDNVNQLIQQIKTRKSVTIITYSKDSRIKPNRS